MFASLHLGGRVMTPHFTGGADAYIVSEIRKCPDWPLPGTPAQAHAGREILSEETVTVPLRAKLSMALQSVGGVRCSIAGCLAAGIREKRESDVDERQRNPFLPSGTGLLQRC